MYWFLDLPSFYFFKPFKQFLNISFSKRQYISCKLLTPFLVQNKTYNDYLVVTLERFINKIPLIKIMPTDANLNYPALSLVISPYEYKSTDKIQGDLEKVMRLLRSSEQLLYEEISKDKVESDLAVMVNNLWALQRNSRYNGGFLLTDEGLEYRKTYMGRHGIDIIFMGADGSVVKIGLPDE